MQWQSTNRQLEAHYQRSLLLQRVRASVFRAFKEVQDAVNIGDPDVRQEFASHLQPVSDDFQQWAKLATQNVNQEILDDDLFEMDDDDDDDEIEEESEVQQVTNLRNAYEKVVQTANQVFYLAQAGRKPEAFALLEGQLGDIDFRRFQELSEQSVASDQRHRQQIQQRTQTTQQTSELVLLIAAFGMISLVFLFAAYLAADLFTPLKEVIQALNDLAHGNWQRRLDEDRNDEFGAVNQAFNQMAAAIQEREQILSVVTTLPDAPIPSLHWEEMPSRLTLHRLV